MKIHEGYIVKEKKIVGFRDSEPNRGMQCHPVKETAIEAKRPTQFYHSLYHRELHL